MAKEYVHFSGKAKWARLITPDTKFDKWNIVLYFDSESLEKFRELQATKGFKNVIKKDEDGWHVNFSRPTQKLMRGKVVGFNPPQVLIKDEEGKEIPYERQMGNGSDVTILCEMYEHGTPGGGKAHALRLEKVRINNLVPFDGEVDVPEEDKAAFHAIKDVPEPIW